MSGEDILALFQFTMNPAEIIIRGSAVYWFLFALFRFVLRRDVGSIAIADILLLVMIADASQNAMAGEYKSIADGFVLIATLAGWNYLLDWSSYHFAWVRRFVQAKPLLLVRNGKLMRANMRKELVTVAELETRLREEGVPSIEDVVTAYLEDDGEISILLKEDADKSGGKRSKKPAPT